MVIGYGGMAWFGEGSKRRYRRELNQKVLAIHSGYVVEDFEESRKVGDCKLTTKVFKLY